MATRDEFRPLRGADGYAYTLPEIATEFRVERLRRERGELVGELTVSCGLPGSGALNGVLSVADLNFSSARAGQERGRILADRAKLGEIGWTDLLEQFRQKVIAADRIGQPAILLRDVSRPNGDDALDVAGLRLLRRHPVTIFGDGGDAKSYLALYLATCLADAGLRVLIADWELAGEDHRDRLERLCGPDMPAIWYARCERPLTAEADRLRRIVGEEQIDYLICDSVAFAADGPPEAAEVAGNYFRALRRIGVGSLNIAHTTKAEGGDQKPFGSTFWNNGSRATFYVKRSAEGEGGNRLTIGLFNRKANLGPIAPPLGYEITFGPERTTFERVPLVGVPDLARRMPIWQQVKALLERGSLTVAEIAHELDEQVGAVTKAVDRGTGKVFVKVPGADGIYRIGLLSERVAA